MRSWLHADLHLQACNSLPAQPQVAIAMYIRTWERLHRCPGISKDDAILKVLACKGVLEEVLQI